MIRIANVINEFNHLHHFFDDEKNYEELEMAIYCYTHW